MLSEGQLEGQLEEARAVPLEEVRAEEPEAEEEVRKMRERGAQNIHMWCATSVFRCGK